MTPERIRELELEVVTVIGMVGGTTLECITGQFKIRQFALAIGSEAARDERERCAAIFPDDANSPIWHKHAANAIRALEDER